MVEIEIKSREELEVPPFWNRFKIWLSNKTHDYAIMIDYDVNKDLYGRLECVVLELDKEGLSFGLEKVKKVSVFDTRRITFDMGMDIMFDTVLKELFKKL